MPKVNSQIKPHVCNICGAGFQIINSLYAHYKSKHNVSYSIKKRSNGSESEPEVNELDLLRDQFIKGSISAVEFEEKSKIFNEKILSQQPKLKIDIAKLCDREYSSKLFTNTDNSLIIEQIRVNKHKEIFLSFFKGQLRIKNNKIEYLYDGSIVKEEYSVNFLYKIYSCLLNGLSHILNNKFNKVLDEESRIAIHEINLDNIFPTHELLMTVMSVCTSANRLNVHEQLENCIPHLTCELIH